MNEESLKSYMQICIDLLEVLDKEVSKSLMQNEQFVLDFYDKLNAISIRR